MKLLRSSVALVGSLCLVGSTALFNSSAEAQPRYVMQPRYVSEPRNVYQPRNVQLVGDYDSGSAYAEPEVLSLDPATAQRRCNIGRLLGGLAGGGIGYAASRQDGRSWAIPLGALLGSQFGCPLAKGQGPLAGLGF